MQYGAHHPMQHYKGFTGSHQTPPSGNCSLHFTPAATRATTNTMIMQHVPTLLAVLMAILMRLYYTARIARWRRFVAVKKATKHHHRASTRSDITQPDRPMPVVSDISSQKRAPVDMLAPNNNWGMTYQTDENNFNMLGWLNKHIIVIVLVFYDMSLTN